MASNREMNAGRFAPMELQNAIASCEIVRKRYTVTEHADDLLESIKECYEKGQFCDVTFVVGSEEIKAHKVVLSSCSEYFKTLLDIRWNNSDRKAVVIEAFDVATFKSVLDFAYTGVLKPIHCSNVLKLLEAGDFFQLDFIKRASAEFLQTTIDVENCLLMLATANRFNLAELRDFVVQFIANNYYRVSQSENFLEVSIEFFIEVLESESLVVDKGETFLPPVTEQENFVLQSVLKFISHQPEDIKPGLLHKLLKSVRLLLIPPSCLEELIENENMSSCIEAKSLAAKALDHLKNSYNNPCSTSAAEEQKYESIIPQNWFEQRRATIAENNCYNTYVLPCPGESLAAQCYFDDREVAAGVDTFLSGMKLWLTNSVDHTYFCGMKLFYSNGATSLHGSHDTDDVEEFCLEEGERIVKANIGFLSWAISSFTFITSKDRIIGPFGESALVSSDNAITEEEQRGAFGYNVPRGQRILEEKPGPYGFLGYMRGSVRSVGREVCFQKFSLVWKEFALTKPRFPSFYHE